MQGYGHPAYAASLSEIGEPCRLSHSGGWILVRPIAGFPQRDAMGCYPIFVCEDWSQLSSDLEEIGEQLVCLSLVTDPFGDYDENQLRRCFRNVVLPFKQHLVIDLSRPLESFAHPHHRRNARKALSELQVQRIIDPAECLDDWVDLYHTLMKRHRISGISLFSRESFARQLRVPGISVFRARDKDVTVGMLLYYAQDDRSYYHLGAYSPRGYESRASFALFDYSIRYFAENGFTWLDLGAGAGVDKGRPTGLSRFKQGWATGVRTAFFCGRIFDNQKYEEIVSALNAPATEYFPAYRAGEFS